MITARPVPRPTGPLVRMVFVTDGVDYAASYLAWIGRMGAVVDGRVAPPARADLELGEPPRPVPTVLVAAGRAIGAALEVCRRSAHPPDRLIIAPFQAAKPDLAEPGRAEPVGALLVVLACEPDSDADPGWAAGWRRATTGPFVVRTFGTDLAGLLAPQSPVVPALMEMFRIDQRWFAGRRPGLG